MTVPATLLTEGTEATVQAVGQTDLLVGIPSYNNVGTIGHVVRAVTAGSRPPVWWRPAHTGACK